MTNITEKRRYARKRVSLPLQYKEIRGNTYLARGSLTKDLSEGGVKFVSDRFLPLACHLLLEMKLPTMGKPIKAISKIAWIQKLPFGDNYVVGNQFLAMSDEDEAAISSLLNPAAF